MDCRPTYQPAEGMDPILIGLTNLAMMVPGALIAFAVWYVALLGYRSWARRDMDASAETQAKPQFEPVRQHGGGQMDMSNTDDDERHLRLELMRLDRKLKMLDLRRMDQQLAYAPIKLLLLAVVIGGALATLLLLLAL